MNHGYYDYAWRDDTPDTLSVRFFELNFQLRIPSARLRTGTPYPSTKNVSSFAFLLSWSESRYSSFSLLSVLLKRNPMDINMALAMLILLSKPQTGKWRRRRRHFGRPLS